jgi:hypothetical protein
MSDQLLRLQKKENNSQEKEPKVLALQASARDHAGK